MSIDDPHDIAKAVQTLHTLLRAPRDGGGGHRVRDRKRSGSWIRPLRRQAIYLRDDFTCIYCGQTPGSDLTLDHVDPMGGHGAENLVTCCRSCNSSKGSMDLATWRPDLITVVRRATARPTDVVVLRVGRYLQAYYEARVAHDVARGILARRQDWTDWDMGGDPGTPTGRDDCPTGEDDCPF